MTGERTHPERDGNEGDGRSGRVRREDFVELVVDGLDNDAGDGVQLGQVVRQAQIILFETVGLIVRIRRLGHCVSPAAD